jgi:rhodanese-related sulfurtransferase
MSYDTVTPTGAKALFDGDGGWTYVDVRTVEEFEAGHAPGSYNAPIAFRTAMGMEMNEAFLDAVRAAFPPDAPLVLGCAAGVRSARACEVLAAAGYKRLVNMDGGFSGSRTVQGWVAHGLPVTGACAPERTWAALSARAAER